MITTVGKGMAAPDISGVRIGEKWYYVDQSGVIWLKYTLIPIPENAADPAIGVAKKEPGKDWQNLNFGTAGLGVGLPNDVSKAFQLD